MRESFQSLPNRNQDHETWFIIFISNMKFMMSAMIMMIEMIQWYKILLF